MTKMILPGAGPAARAVDDYAPVMPEARQEQIDGRIIEAAPAGRAHGDTHVRLAGLLMTHTASGYESSLDLLTRTSDNWCFAADGSIRKQGDNPDTGGRWLEEVVFEIRSEQTRADLERRARELSQRGVRRIFAIDARLGAGGQVLVGPVSEWLADEERWHLFREDEVILDPTLVRPLPVKEILDAAAADDGVAHALLARHNRVLAERAEQARDDGYKAGKDDGYREAVASLCELLGIELTPKRRATLAAATRPQLAALFARIETERRWDDG